MSSILLTNFEFTFKLIDEIMVRRNLSELLQYQFIQGSESPSNITQISIYFESEHNIVHIPHDTMYYPLGKIPVLSLPIETYNCRIIYPKIYQMSDLIIEYNAANNYNMASTGVWGNFMKKVVYVPPLVFPYEPYSHKRFDMVTTMILLGGRRGNIIMQLYQNGLNITNFSQNYSLPDLHHIFSHTKILINIHQTPHHHTLEEFRIVPALLRGAIVVSEEIPMKELIPYHSYIIWTNITDLYVTLKHVSDHYSDYFNRIHGKDSKLKELFHQMKVNASIGLESRLVQILEEKKNITRNVNDSRTEPGEEYYLPPTMLKSPIAQKSSPRHPPPPPPPRRNNPGPLRPPHPPPRPPRTKSPPPPPSHSNHDRIERGDYHLNLKESRADRRSRLSRRLFFYLFLLLAVAFVPLFLFVLCGYFLGELASR
jgi:hypothetical protein